MYRTFTLSMTAYNHASMNKTHLLDKKVSFRLIGAPSINIGVVQSIESDGFWIQSPQLINELQQDRSWGPAVAQIQIPVLFVPTSSLVYLIAAKD